jgi:multiple sugar transport system permease protein
MFYPGIILLVPSFLLVRSLRLYNTYGAMIVPLLVNVWAIFMYSNFFRGIDRAVVDSARVDGAGEFRIVFCIMVPIARPITTVVFLFLFMERWVELLWDLLMVKDPELQTLNVLLATMFGPYGTFQGPLYAAGVLLTFPILIVFALFGRQIIQGVQFVLK